MDTPHAPPSSGKTANAATGAVQRKEARGADSRGDGVDEPRRQHQQKKGFEDKDGEEEVYTALDLAESGTTRLLREGREQLRRYGGAAEESDRGHAGGPARSRSHYETTSPEERLLAEVSAGVDRIAAGGSPTREDSPQSISRRLAALTMMHVTAIRNPDSRSPSPDVRRVEGGGGGGGYAY